MLYNKLVKLPDSNFYVSTNNLIYSLNYFSKYKFVKYILKNKIAYNFLSKLGNYFEYLKKTNYRQASQPYPNLKTNSEHYFKKSEKLFSNFPSIDFNKIKDINRGKNLKYDFEMNYEMSEDNKEITLEEINEKAKIVHLLKSSIGNKAHGIKKLDKHLFSCEIKILTIELPQKTVSAFLKKFKMSLCRIPNIKSIADIGSYVNNLKNSSSTSSKYSAQSDKLNINLTDSSSNRLLMLDPFKYQSITDLDQYQVNFLKENFFENINNICRHYDLRLNYDNFTYDEILSCILPDVKSQDKVGGFSLVGHIAHLNLKDDLLEYKNIIGEVILDKIFCVRTVVNKLKSIHNEFRNFEMEVIAGQTDFMVTSKEHGCTFKFDFSKVYWNPRLATEHQKIVSNLNSGDIIYDLFSGIGPFAIPAAKKKCCVLANDLNPESYKWLLENAKLNLGANYNQSNFKAFNMDAKIFIKTVVKDDLIKLIYKSIEESNLSNENFNNITDNNSKSKNSKVLHFPSELKTKIHVIMNLPDIAIHFLDSFKNLLDVLNNDIFVEFSKSQSKNDIYKNPNTKNLIEEIKNKPNLHILEKSEPTNTNEEIFNNNNNIKSFDEEKHIHNFIKEKYTILKKDNSLDNFNENLNSNNKIKLNKLFLPEIVIHCYCFSKSQNPEEDAKQRVLEALLARPAEIKTVTEVVDSNEKLINLDISYTNETDLINSKNIANSKETFISYHEFNNFEIENLINMKVRRVRNVAPKKEMLSVSFEMPYSYLMGDIFDKHKLNIEEECIDKSFSNHDEPLLKRIKTS